MGKVYVLSAVNSENFVGNRVLIKFCGVYQGESFRDIYLDLEDEIAMPTSKTPCIIEIAISKLEKSRITGKLISIKFLEEFQ